MAQLPVVAGPSGCGALSGGRAGGPIKELAGFQHRVHGDDVLDNCGNSDVSRTRPMGRDQPGRLLGYHHRQPRCA
jgi:hypothetical protein